MSDNEHDIPIHRVPPQNDDPDLETVETSSSGAEPETMSGDTGKDWQAEAEQFKDQCLRTQAEMENMKKRLEREKSEFLKFANESLIKDLLPVVDNLERALEHAGNESGGEGLTEGVRLTYEGLKSALEKNGVQQVQARGEIFDPHFHEAVMQKEDPSVENNTVLEEIQKGYLLNGRLLRPAMVVVSKRPGS